MINELKINWGAVGIFLTLAWITLLFFSSLIPYVSSASVDFFFWYIFSSLIFLFTIYLGLKPREDGSGFHRAFRGDESMFGDGHFAVFKVVAILLVFSVGSSFVSKFLLSYPTDFFAKDRFSEHAKVDDEYRYAFSFRGLNRVELSLADGGEMSFFWPTSRSNGVDIHSCVVVSGRKWALGSRVEAIDVVPCT